MKHIIQDFDYRKIYYRRPLLTEENLRLWSITAFIGSFYLILTLILVDWSKSISDDRIVMKIKQKYLTYLQYQEITVPDRPRQIQYSSILIDERWPFIKGIPSGGEDFDENDSQTLPLTTNQILARGEGLFNNMESRAIAAAVKSVPGPNIAGTELNRREKILSLEKSSPVYQSHDNQIGIPLPKTIQFASQNGLRDIYETTAVMDKNEIDIKYCLEKAVRINPGISAFVLVRFSIHPEGFVIPSSIKIIDTNITDQNIIQCIIQNIRRWRNFKQISPENGNFNMTRKYVF